MTTVKEYAEQHGVTETAARRALEGLVKKGDMRKVVYDEMEYRRFRGYSGRMMPVKVANYYPIQTESVSRFRQEAKARGCSGYRILVDGQQIVFKRWCKALENEILSIAGTPAIFRNMLGELALDYRDDYEK